MNKKFCIKLQASVSREKRDATPHFSLESYVVGIGFIGKKKSPIIRRFVRCRNENGICSYFLWADPDKGKLIPRVYGFRFRKRLTREEVTAHYK